MISSWTMQLNVMMAAAIGRLEVLNVQLNEQHDQQRRPTRAPQPTPTQPKVMMKESGRR
jgi:hypothetical protein